MSTVKEDYKKLRENKNEKLKAFDLELSRSAFGLTDLNAIIRTGEELQEAVQGLIDMAKEIKEEDRLERMKTIRENIRRSVTDKFQSVSPGAYPDHLIERAIDKVMNSEMVKTEARYSYKDVDVAVKEIIREQLMK